MSNSYTPKKFERTPYNGVSVFAQINELQQRVAELEAALEEIYELTRQEEEGGICYEGPEASGAGSTSSCSTSWN